MSPEAYRNRYSFNPAKKGFVGRELEAGIQRRGEEVPAAAEILAHWKTSGVPGGTPRRIPREFGYELSACQFELRTRPRPLSTFREELVLNDWRARQLVESLGYTLSFAEIGPRDMPLDVYPDPKGRYQQIVRGMSQETLLAACITRGTHIHVGMPDHETALRVYNYVIQFVDELCELGNGSFGERLAIYRQMAPNYVPKPYTDWDDFYLTACREGFAHDPRRCWTLIRISVHGTIEFRMFGATDSIDRVVRWAERCEGLCREALVSF